MTSYGKIAKAVCVTMCGVWTPCAALQIPKGQKVISTRKSSLETLYLFHFNNILQLHHPRSILC